MSSSVEVKHNIDFGLKQLEGIEKAIKEKIYTKVGILGNKPRNDEESEEVITNAEIGIIHEFGSIKRNIPPRSFLRMPVQTKAKQIKKQLLKNKKKYEKSIASGDISKLFEDLGIAAEVVIQEAFETGGFGKWQELKHREGTILVDTSQLRGSITSKVVKGSG
jgi:phage gpG-like protein